METLYSLVVNNIPGMPGPLPDRLRLPDGMTRTSLNELTFEQLNAIGIYLAQEVRPAYTPETQYLSGPTLSFDGTIVTATYTVVDKSAEEILAEINRTKIEKFDELANHRWTLEVADFEWNGHLFVADERSQTKMLKALISAMNNPSFTEQWKLADGTYTEMTGQNFIDLSAAYETFVRNLFVKEATLRYMITNIAESAELTPSQKVLQMNAITWDSV